MGPERVEANRIGRVMVIIIDTHVVLTWVRQERLIDSPLSHNSDGLTQGHARKRWSNQAYEEQCFFFNTLVRTAPHPHGVQGAALTPTWDCASEVAIWRAYKLKEDPAGFGALGSGEQDAVIAELSVALTQHVEGAQGREWLRRVDWSVVKGDKGGRGGGRSGGGWRRKGGGGGGGGWQGHDDRHRRRDWNGGDRGRKRRCEDGGEEEEGEGGGGGQDRKQRGEGRSKRKSEGK